jgi:hypothetical protein
MKFFLSYASDHDRPEAEAIKKELEELDVVNPRPVFGKTHCPHRWSRHHG